MAAADHLHPELFHGTGHVFGEGETIDPQEGNVRGHVAGELLSDPSPAVYMSDDLSRAFVYAGSAAIHTMRLFGPVYSVEHSPDIINLHDALEKEGKSGRLVTKGTYISHKPVKPKEIVAWATNRDLLNPVNEDD